MILNLGLLYENNLNIWFDNISAFECLKKIGTKNTNFQKINNVIALAVSSVLSSLRY